MTQRLLSLPILCAVLGVALLPARLAAQTTPVPVPKQSFTSSELYQPLRTFTAEEIGQRPTFAAMHRGHLVISGGRSDATGQQGKLSTWRLSQAGSPNAVNPSRVGVHENNEIFKSHAQGFIGEFTQIRAGKFSLYNLSDMSAPQRESRAAGGKSSSHSSCLAGRYLYTGGEGYGTASGWVDVWDVADPANPALLRTVDVPSLTGFRCASVYVLGNVMVVSASLTNGVATFDISNPTDPRLLDVCTDDSGAVTYTSYLSGNWLYGGGQAGGFFVYDLADPADIQVVGHLPKGDGPGEISGNVRYPVLQDEYIHVGNLGSHHYQKIRIDTMPPVVEADIAGFPRAEIAIPVGNLVFLGSVATDPDATGWLIPHDTAPDNRSPEVNAVRPVDGESNVGLNSLVGVSFTDLLDTPSIDSTSLIVRPQGGSALSGTYSNMGGIVNFSPDEAFAPNTVYEIVVVDGGIEDVSGNPVAAETVSTFSTGALDATGVGLTLHYPLDENEGAVANDSAGTLPGTLVNFGESPAWSALSAVGPGALDFDGVDDHIRTPSLDSGDAFSLSAWVRVPSGTGGLHTIAGNTAGGGATDGWKVFLYGSEHSTQAGRIRLETGNGTAGNSASTAVGALPFDRWVHVVTTLDRGSGEARIWIDGTDATGDSTIRTDFKTNGELYWARMGTGGAYLPGTLDDLRLYGRVLEAEDVEQLQQAAPLMLTHWRLNGSPDDSANGEYPLMLSASGASYDPADSAEGPESLALDNGFAASPSLDTGPVFTAAAWVRVDSGNASLNTLFGNTTGGYQADGWKCFVYGSDHATQAGRVRLETGNGINGNSASTGTGALPFDQWVHVAVGLDRDTGTARITLDGVDVTADTTVRDDFNTAGPVHLGQMTNGSYRLDGALDDVRLHARWLWDHDIALLAIGKRLGHWAMEGTDGDLSGFGRDLVRHNGQGFSGNAAVGSLGLDYDGVDDSAEVSEAFSLGDRFTLSLWAWLPSGLPDGSRTLIANANGGTYTDGFRWFVNSWNTGNLAIRFENANGTQHGNIQASPGTYLPDQWNHLAMVVDRAGGTADMYLNRVKVNTASGIRPDFQNTGALRIGSFTNGGARWQGQIDEVRVYDKLATAADLAALGHGAPNTAPVLHDLTSSSTGVTTGSSVEFTADASDPNVGDNLLYRFDFGDGTQTGWQSSPTASHTYTAPGRYVVTVTASDGTTTTVTSLVQIVYNPVTATPPSFSSEMAFDSVRGQVWCVVPDGNDHDNDPATTPVGSVVRFDASTLAVADRVSLGPGVEAVACALRPGGSELWVACKNSRLPDGEIAILDADTAAVLDTITVGRGYLPTGIAFAPDGSGAFLACEGAEGVLKYDPATRSLAGSADLGGPVRGIAVTGDSARLFVTRFRSPDSGGEVHELDPADLSPVRTFVLAPDTTTQDSDSGARGLPNYLMQAVPSPDGERLWIPAKKDNIYRGEFRDGEPLNHENTVRSLVAQLDLGTNAEATADRLDLNDAHFPAALCFSPRGDLVFAAMIGNEQVEVIDANNRNTLSPIDLRSDTSSGNSALFGHAPSSLCLSDDGQFLYVHNFLERRVRVFDVGDIVDATGSTAQPVGSVDLVDAEPLDSEVLLGKQLFHNARDPRLALDNYISCASCHLGGDQDGRTWDLGNFGEGLRQTIDLRGHGGMAHGALHWSANFDEVQDFENQIRDLSGGSGLIENGTPHPSTGQPNAGRSSDLDALAAYVASLDTQLRSPYRNPDGTLTPEATAGRAHFDSLGCAQCHSGTRFTDSGSDILDPLLHDTGTWLSTSGERLGQANDSFDTPSLRGLWSTAPYLHDGRHDTLEDFAAAFAGTGTVHDTASLTAAEQDELVAYLYEIDEDEPGPPAPLAIADSDRWTQATGWKTVTHGGGFADPVVLVGPLTANGGDDAVVRVRNVGPDSFEYTVEEWEYLDGSHGADETIHFLVMDEGTRTIDGKQVTVGTRDNVTHGFGTQSFPASFGTVPTVFAQVVTENDPETVATRIRNVGTGSFQVRVQEEEGSADGGVHAGETLHYLALEPGDYPTLGVRVGNTPDAVTHNTYRVDFGGAVGTEIPVVLTGMQTTDGGDPCALRWIESSLDNTGLDLFLEEEQSANSETDHTTEVVGWIVFGSP